VALIGFLGPLLGIAFGFDAINQERADGTLPRLVSQPIHRDDVVNGKFAAGLATIGVTLVMLVAVTSGVGIVRMGITPAPADVARLLAYLVVTLAYIGVWLAFAILCSVVLRRAATAALAAISAWIVLTLFGTFLAGLVADAAADDQLGQLRMEHTLTQLTPAGLYESSTAALLDPSVRTVGIVFAEQVDRAVASTLSLGQSMLVVWPQVTALIAGCVVLFTVAYMAFLRQEIRA
jgi:ABC-2 type transport system permease protein